MRRLKAWQVVLGLFGLLCATVVAFQVFGLFEHWPNGVINEVKLSRYLLGRWPTDWPEVERTIVQFPGEPKATKRPFESVSIRAKNDSECTLVLSGRNLIGIYSENAIVINWTSADEARWTAELKWREKVQRDLYGSDGESVVIDPPLGSATEDPGVKKAGDELMAKMYEMAWYAPALQAVRTAIAIHHRDTGMWPSGLKDLSALEIPFTYRSHGSLVSDSLDASNTSFKFLHMKKGYAVYDFEIKGVEDFGQEIGSDELEGLRELDK